MTVELAGPSTGALLTYLRITLPIAGLTPREQTVAWTIASHYNPREGCSRPSYKAVAEEMHLSKDVIWRCVRAITSAGIWKVERGTSSKNKSHYRFPLAAQLAIVETGPETAAELSTPSARPADGSGDELSARSANVTVTRTETSKLCAPDAADETWLRCIHSGCLLRVDPLGHRFRCEEHDAQHRARSEERAEAGAAR
jgi:hypothetical protein